MQCIHSVLVPTTLKKRGFVAQHRVVTPLPAACSFFLLFFFSLHVDFPAKGKGQPQTRININTALVEDIINLEEVDEEMKSVMEALKDNFNKTLNIRTSPGE